MRRGLALALRRIIAISSYVAARFLCTRAFSTGGGPRDLSLDELLRGAAFRVELL